LSQDQIKTELQKIMDICQHHLGKLEKNDDEDTYSLISDDMKLIELLAKNTKKFADGRAFILAHETFRRE
jgi:hypothetical protein